MKIKTLLLTCALPLFTWQSFAQAPVIVYSGASVPTEQGWNESKLDATVNDLAAPTTATVESGVLKLTSTNAANQYSERKWVKSDLNFDLNTGFTLEIKAKVTAADKTGAFNIQGYDKNGKGFRIGILNNAVTEQTNPFAATKILASEITNGDGFHIFRIAFSPLGVAAVYRDEVLLGTFAISTFQFDNIIENGGFEDEEYADFTSNGILSRVTDPKLKRYGNYALEMNSNGLITDYINNEGAHTREIAVKPNTEYDISITRRRTANEPWAWRDMGAFYDFNKGSIGLKGINEDGRDEARRPMFASVNDRVWQAHNQSITTPADAKTIRFEFPSWERDGSKRNVTSSFDNFTLREKPTFTIGTTVNPTSGFPEVGFHAGYVNLIQNGGFEDHAINNDGSEYAWALSSEVEVNSNEPVANNPLWNGNVRIQRNDKPDDQLGGQWAHNGTSSLRFSTLGNGNSNFDFTKELEAGKTYRFNFWHRNPHWNDYGWIRVKVGDEIIWGHQLGGRNNVWANCDLVFTATETNKTLHLYSTSDTHGGWMNIFFDDFVLYEMTETTLVDTQIQGKTNLIINGDFEDVNSGNDGLPYTWALASERSANEDNYPVKFSEMWGSYVRLQDKQKTTDTGLKWAHSGNKSLRFSYLDDYGQAQAFEGLSNDVLPDAFRANMDFKKELEPNKTYTFVFWLKTANYGDKGRIAVANGDVPLWEEELSTKYINWTRQSITFSTTANNHTLRLYTKFGGWFNFYLDDLFLFEEDVYVPAPESNGSAYLAFGKSTGASSTDVEVEYIKMDNTGSFIHTAMFNSNGGSAVGPQVVDGMVVEPAAPSKEGYAFTGWYTDMALTTPYVFSAPLTTDITLYAKWAIRTYTVTFNANGGSDVAPQPVEYLLKASTPEIPTRAGYDFTGWYTDVELTTLYNFNTPVTADITLYAQWVVNQFAVTFDSNGGSAVATQTVTKNEKATEPNVPKKAGNTFEGWYLSDLTTLYDFNTVVTAEITLFAKWLAGDYTETFYVDFGQDASTWGDKTIGVDANGNIWNNVVAPAGAPSSLAAGYTLDFVNSQGETTPVSIELINKISSNGKPNCGLPDPDATLLGDIAVGTATNDYFFIDDGIGNQGWFRFKGLDTQKAYKFYVFGTRQTNDVRGGTFYIHGQNQFNDFLQTSGAGIGTNITNTNDNTIITSTPIVPNIDGTIDFEFFIASQPSKFVYVNAMKIEEVAVPEALAVEKKFYIDFGKNNSGLDGTLTANPDVNNNHWNNVYSNGDGGTRGASDGTGNLTLVASDNTASAYVMELANNNVEFNGVRNGALTTPDAALLGDFAIATATHDYVFTNNDGDITLNFKNLNVAKRYRFKLFGSRADDSGRMGLITIAGKNTISGAHQMGGKHIGGTGVNYNNRIVFVSDTIAPTTEGQISFAMKQKFGMAHINVMSMEELTVVYTDVTNPASNQYKLNVYSNQGALVVKVSTPSDVLVYNTLGMLISTAKVDNMKTFNLPTGAYFVKSVAANGEMCISKVINK